MPLSHFKAVFFHCTQGWYCRAALPKLLPSLRKTPAPLMPSIQNLTAHLTGGLFLGIMPWLRIWTVWLWLRWVQNRKSTWVNSPDPPSPGHSWAEIQILCPHSCQPNESSSPALTEVSSDQLRCHWSQLKDLPPLLHWAALVLPGALIFSPKVHLILSLLS